MNPENPGTFSKYVNQATTVYTPNELERPDEEITQSSDGEVMSGTGLSCETPHVGVLIEV